MASPVSTSLPSSSDMEFDHRSHSLNRKSSKMSISASGIVPDEIRSEPRTSVNMDQRMMNPAHQISDDSSVDSRSEGSVDNSGESDEELSRVSSYNPTINGLSTANACEPILTKQLTTVGDFDDINIQTHNHPSIQVSPIMSEIHSTLSTSTPTIFTDHMPIITEQQQRPDDESLSVTNFSKMLSNTQTIPLINTQITLDAANHSSDGIQSKDKNFFILSSAGKPIYSMHGTDNITTVYSGVIQLVMSFFDCENQNLKSVVARTDDGRNIKFAFLNRSPILLLATSSIGDSNYQLEQQLNFLYNFLLATLSKPHIEKVFQRRENFDLRNTLGKTDIKCLDSICESFINYNNCGMIVGGLECVRLHKTIRDRIDRILLKHRTENILYGLLVAPNGRLISILRPKRHTLHTSDLQLLFSILYGTDTFKSSIDKQDGMINSRNEDFWVPICLPKFNPNGFLYAFIQFVDLKDERLMRLHDLALPQSATEGSDFAVILLSAFKETFFEMRTASRNIIQDIRLSRPIYRELFKVIMGSSSTNFEKSLPYGRVSPINIPAPLIKHFIFKSKRHTQYVYSKLRGSLDDERSQDSAMTTAQIMQIYSWLLTRRGDNIPLVTATHTFISNDLDLTPFNNGSYVDIANWVDHNDSMVGLLISTPTYDLYAISTGASIDRQALLRSCQKIVRWCWQNQDRLFIKSGATF